MLPEADRVSPLRHSKKSAAFAALLELVALYLSFDFFGPGALALVAPLLLATSLGVFFYRFRGVVSRLPRPHGGGRVAVLDADRVRTQGLMIVGLGVATLFVPFIALYFLSAEAVVAFVLALMGGLAGSELLYFAWVTRLERRLGATVLSRTEFREQKGRQELFKSLELEPWDEKGKDRPASPVDA